MNKQTLTNYLKTIEKVLKKEKLLSQEANDSLAIIGRLILAIAQEEKLIKDNFVARELENSEAVLAVYSDGACKGNPGPGAYGVMIQDRANQIIFESHQAYQQTTNNQMELLGVIEGLKASDEYLNRNTTLDRNLVVVTDSKYVIDGITKWVIQWKNRGWKKADNKTPENLELWQTLDSWVGKFATLNFIWVKGHSGHPQNERCDELCNIALDHLDN